MSTFRHVGETIVGCKSTGGMSAEGNGQGHSCWDRCVHWGDFIVRGEPKRDREPMMRSGQHLMNGGNHLANGNGSHLGNGKAKTNGYVQSEYLLLSGEGLLPVCSVICKYDSH